VTETTSARLERAVSCMQAPLVTERARDKLLAFSRVACPNVDLVYVEYRVSSEEADQVDVSVSAAAYAARAALTRRVGQLARSDAASWAGAGSTLERWCVRGTDEARLLGAAYLEYDLDANVDTEGRNLGPPSLFVQTLGLSYSWDLERTRCALHRAVTWVTAACAPAYDAPLEAVLLALPQNFVVAHLGFMFSRADEALRFALAIPSPDVDPFLRRLGWAGTLAPCRERLALAEQSGWVTLAFGFGGARLGDRLGIEVRPRGRANGEALLSTLVRRGWCTPAKGEALSALLRHRHEGYRCQLSHAKFVVSRASGVETKIYVTLEPDGARMGRLAALGQIPARARPATPAAPRCPTNAG
jgi:hypothetical protein